MIKSQNIKKIYIAALMSNGKRNSTKDHNPWKTPHEEEKQVMTIKINEETNLKTLIKKKKWIVV